MASNAGTNVNALIAAVPKLNSLNYHEWKFAISMVLRRAGCWDIVLGKKERPDSPAKAGQDWDTNAEEGLTTIGLAVEADQYHYIRDSPNGVHAWSALAAIYEKNSRANRIALKSIRKIIWC